MIVRKVALFHKNKDRNLVHRGWEQDTYLKRCLELAPDSLLAQAAGLRRVRLGGDGEAGVLGRRLGHDAARHLLRLSVGVDPGRVEEDTC